MKVYQPGPQVGPDLLGGGATARPSRVLMAAPAAPLINTSPIPSLIDVS